MTTPTAELYRDDYYAWALDQARALRRLAETRPNAAIDFERLIEEVEGLAAADLREVKSELGRAIQHLLKLEHARNAGPRFGWRTSVIDARSEIEDRLTPTMRPEVEVALPRIYAQARRAAENALLQHGDQDAAAALPRDCPYTLGEILADDWFPASRNGLTDQPG
jgi:hypothetical protein